NLILVHTGDRDLGSTDEKEVFALDSVDLVTSFGELSVADEAEIACHRWYDQGRKAFAGDAIHGKVHQRQFHTGCITLEGIAAGASNLDGTFDIDQIVLLHQGIVVERLKVKGGFLAPIANRHVVILILPNGCARIRNIGD